VRFLKPSVSLCSVSITALSCPNHITLDFP
ncbi:unnamed protein product, partial [Allacma fusca]